MKRILVSAAALIFIVPGVFASNKKIAVSSSAKVALNQLSSKFAGIATVVPSKITVDKNLEVYNEYDEDEGAPQAYTVFLEGKHYNGEAHYDANGTLQSYEDKIKDTKMPVAVMDAIKEKYPSATFAKDKEIIKDSENSKEDEYKVHFKDGRKHYTALVENNGNIIHMHGQFI